MSWPDPVPGVVIRNAYLWYREADLGREEWVKVPLRESVAAVQEEAEGLPVYVLPITHSPPQPPDEGIELPPATKARLGLDSERSWIIISEANRFSWSGPESRLS